MVEVVLDDRVIISMCGCMFGGVGGGVKVRNLCTGSSYFAEKHLDAGNDCNHRGTVQSLNANGQPSNSQGVSLPHAATWRPGALGVLVCACVA